MWNTFVLCRRMNRTPPAEQHVSRVVRDNRIFINAVLDTVKELNRIGVRAVSRVEERNGAIDVIVTIRPAAENEKISLNSGMKKAD